MEEFEAPQQSVDNAAPWPHGMDGGREGREGRQVERLAWLQVAYQSRGRGTALCPLDARRVDRRTTAEELEREEVAPGDVAVAARGDDMTERQKDRKAKRESGSACIMH